MQNIHPIYNIKVKGASRSSIVCADRVYLDFDDQTRTSERPQVKERIVGPISSPVQSEESRQA